MDLTKKSVSDIERKLKYARYAMRVLKDCHLVHEWVEYTKTDNYKRLKVKDIEENKTTSAWYDYDNCGSIFGRVNFSQYFWMHCRKEPYNTYVLLNAYLALFDEEEFNKHGKVYSTMFNAKEYIKKVLNKEAYGINDNDVKMVKKWIKEKETLYGSKDCFV